MIKNIDAKNKEKVSAYHKTRSLKPSAKAVQKTASEKFDATEKSKIAHRANSRALSATPGGKVRQRNAGYRRTCIQNADGTQFTTSNEIDAFFSQNGDCKFCLEPLLEDICADHDHITFKFRGLLHKICNRILVGAHTSETTKMLVKYFGITSEML